MLSNWRFLRRISQSKFKKSIDYVKSLSFDNIKWLSSSECVASQREFKPITIEKFCDLYNEDPERKIQIQEILNLYELEKYTTQQVSTDISIKDMRQLLLCIKDEKELKRGIKFLYTRECDKYNSRAKKMRRKIEHENRKLIENKDKNPSWEKGIFDPNGELHYGLWHNSIVSRITDKSLRNYRQNHLLRQAAMFGQKLIIDLSYDEHMKQSEINLLAQQIGFLYYENRINRDYPEQLPFDIHFTNCAKAKDSMIAIAKHIKRMNQLESWFHPQSYLERPDLFPKHRLVYLSPHSKHPLLNYSDDHIYILGGYNDRISHMHISHVKAESEGIACFRLPLDENVLWKQGNKNLCLNQVSAILHSVKATGEWREAIRKFAPQRKIRSNEEEELAEQIRIKEIRKRMKNIAKSHKIHQI
ncbi:Mitochondrial ribonuclease P protein 1 -like protein [Sarcoptes scabiei]|uniref:RNA (guanine-9-)-methyltransferase domain-containing protein 1 n=1 Tax=Sarcoptes scabiei TaxID=52283 RepID=A0A834RCD5_SARSC|nr:Mitochondrial ribonuclease P protein 1 -like protein [Sarcoptes scabiei]UXI22645.1 Dual specificity protein phosphatase 19 [Sarcoptes scabiei]